MPRRLLFALLLCALLLCVTGAARAAPTRGPEAVLQVIGRIESNLRTSAYVPYARIDEKRGVYKFDCSAMAGWILRQAAPKARAAVSDRRPVARDFVRAIEFAPTEKPKRGWQRIDRLELAKPGDVLAWRRPPWFPSRNTGHVAFVLEAPRPVQGGFLVKIADATSVGHENDSRQGTTGYGTGVIGVTVDAQGRGTGYAWYGWPSLQAGQVIETPIVIGRAVK